MIEISDISVTYRSGDGKIPALSDLSLNIDDGEHVSILGPNGSGKSTLVKSLCGLVSLSGGYIKINDIAVKRGEFSKTLFGTVGVVFQEPSGRDFQRAMSET